MTNLRKLAKGRDCQIRLPGICNGNPETVVACHLSGGGMGGKVNDLFAAWGCSSCHDAVDLRSPVPFEPYLLELWHHHGVIRTQEILINEGVL